MGARICIAPDLAVFAEGGTIAVEVELTAKAPYRLQNLIRAWRRTIALRRIQTSEVHYHCAAGQARKAVERAVRVVKAGQLVSIGEAVAR